LLRICFTAFDDTQRIARDRSYGSRRRSLAESTNKSHPSRPLRGKYLPCQSLRDSLKAAFIHLAQDSKHSPRLFLSCS
jgi:hypothetical protein